MSEGYSLWDTIGGATEFAGPGWAAHDSILNAEALRDMDIFVSAMSGIPGKYEDPKASDYRDRVTVGAAIEAVANACTRRFESRLKDLEIPATFRYEATGVHAWSYWKDELPNAWPTLARSFGMPA